jgi:NAD(P)H-flavin reductase
VVKKTVLLATGTGIAPVHAILSSLGADQIARCGDLFLYWGNRRPDDAYFHEPLAHLAQLVGFKYFEVFSRLPRSSGKGARHVQDLMAAQHPDLKNAQVLAAGNAAMIDDGRPLAMALGLPAARFFCDPFTSS